MSATITPENLLSPSERTRLERFRLAPRHRITSSVRGERISRQKGISLEFADFREYASGDDLRHLDWNILGRLDRPTIRTYQSEADLTVYLLLDASASMDFGEPSKFDSARRLALSLGVVALCGQDAVIPLTLGTRETWRAQAIRGRAVYGALQRWAEGIQPAGTLGLAATLQQFVSRGAYRPGMAIVVSDGLDPAAPGAIRAAGARGHEVCLIQVLSEIELEPELEGDLKLIDSENGPPVEITAHAEAIDSYKRNLAAHCAALEDAVQRSGGRYIRVIAGADPIELIGKELRRIGMVE